MANVALVFLLRKYQTIHTTDSSLVSTEESVCGLESDADFGWTPHISSGETYLTLLAPSRCTVELIVIICNSGRGQRCEYERNEADKFVGVGLGALTIFTHKLMWCDR